MRYSVRLGSVESVISRFSGFVGTGCELGKLWVEEDYGESDSWI